MAMRPHEIHPSLVHYPLAFQPLAVATDTLGYLTGNRRLLQAGRWATLLAAGSAALAGGAGFLAQREVEADGDAHDLLVTHRTLNIGLTLTAGLLAAWRWRRRAPTPASLAIGALGLAAMGYSAYLGGKMVYEHGVGVRPAGGLRPGHGTEAWLDNLSDAGAESMDAPAARETQAAGDIAHGDIAPHFNGREREPGDEVGY